VCDYIGGFSYSKTTDVVVLRLLPKIIDVFAYRTPGISETRVNARIAFANKVFQKSGVVIRLRLVHSQEVEYSGEVDNKAALFEMQGGNGVFSENDSLREKYGPDIFVFLRNDVTNVTSAGIAFLNGTRGSDFLINRSFSVVDDDSWEYTLPHEIGHNMGVDHNHENETSGGAFSYSYGYCLNNTGDIMGYSLNPIPLFSSPNIMANGYILGVPEGQPEPADAVRSLNKVAQTVADLVPTKK
jgi:hypothetical protein